MNGAFHLKGYLNNTISSFLKMGYILGKLEVD